MVFSQFCFHQMLTSLLAVATSLPIEDTLEVAAAKAEFKAAFDAASAGEHAALAPVNNDLQAEQIALSYLADSEDVAAAKAEFLAAFDSAAAGGLAAKQAPAPVHAIPAPAPLAAPVAALPAAFPYGVTALNTLPYHGYPYAAGLPYAGLVAHPNGAVVPAEPADVVAARQEHLAAHASA